MVEAFAGVVGGTDADGDGGGHDGGAIAPPQFPEGKAQLLAQPVVESQVEGGAGGGGEVVGCHQPFDGLAIVGGEASKVRGDRLKTLLKTLRGLCATDGKGRSFPPAFDAVVGEAQPQVSAFGGGAAADGEGKAFVDGEWLNSEMHRGVFRC